MNKQSIVTFAKRSNDPVKDKISLARELLKDAPDTTKVLKLIGSLMHYYHIHLDTQFEGNKDKIKLVVSLLNNDLPVGMILNELYLYEYS